MKISRDNNLSQFLYYSRARIIYPEILVYNLEFRMEVTLPYHLLWRQFVLTQHVIIFSYETI